MRTASLLQPCLALTLAPLLSGIIQRTKALWAGRKGPPLSQPYRDLLKLLRKGAVYSRTTTWVFRAGPVVGLATSIGALLVLPLGGVPAAIAFPGDLVLLAYWLGLGRVFGIWAALDTGSSFEGMGASREAAFSALAEPALLLGLAAVARETGSLSVSGMVAGLGAESWRTSGPALLLVLGALFAVFLTENARIPIDEPATHLELTMIHEAQVLDHGGPDLAWIEYAAALRLWVLGGLLVGLAAPVTTGRPWIDGPAFLAGLALLAGIVGVIESSMARLRLVRVPQFLAGATAFAVLALILVSR